MQIEELKLLDIKDKLLVIRSSQLNANSIQSIRKSLFEKGCLGIISIPEGTDISVLGFEQLKSMVGQMEDRIAKEEAAKKG